VTKATIVPDKIVCTPGSAGLRDALGRTEETGGVDRSKAPGVRHLHVESQGAIKIAFIFLVGPLDGDQILAKHSVLSAA
jgi:hypothetical protein